MRRPTAIKLLCALILILLISIALFHLRRSSSVRTDIDVPEVWFEDIKNPISIADSDKEAVIRAAVASVLHKKSIKEGIPTSLKTDTLPRIVFLSLSDGATAAHVALGSGKGIVEAIEKAVSQAHSLSQNGYQIKWIKLDIVNNVYPMRDVNSDTPIGLDGLQGIGFDRESALAFLPEELLSYTPGDAGERIKLSKGVKYLKKRSGEGREFKRLKFSKSITAYRFTTVSLFSDGNDFVSLYRGHRLFNQVSAEELLRAAQLGGEYLIRSVDSKGKFVYTYEPKTDDRERGYNILRHSGTVYAMLELYEVTGERELLRAAERAIKYLLQSAKPCRVREKGATCIVEKGYVKLGGNALAAVALAKYTEVTHDRKHMPVLLKLGRWIKRTQKKTGNSLYTSRPIRTARLMTLCLNTIRAKRCLPWCGSTDSTPTKAGLIRLRGGLII